MKKLTFTLFIFMAMIAMIGCSSDGIKGIEITQNPTKLTYNIGEELNLEGIVVHVIMSDGNKYILAKDQFTVSGYDKMLIGSQTITITHGKHKQTLTIAVVDYNGPLFLGAQIMNEIPSESYVPDFMNKQTIGLASNVQLAAIIGFDNYDYITNVGSSEYIVLYITQPDNDFYSIQTVWINNKPYQIGAFEQDSLGNATGRRVEINMTGTRIYIPITITENMLGENLLEVTRITYIDGDSVKNVLKDEEALDKIVLGVRYKALTVSSAIHADKIRFYPDTRRLISREIPIFEGEIDILIKRVYFNEQLILEFENGLDFKNGFNYRLPDHIIVDDKHNFYLMRFEYEYMPGLHESVYLFAIKNDGVSSFIDLYNEDDFIYLLECLEKVKVQNLVIEIRGHIVLTQQLEILQADLIQIFGTRLPQWGGTGETYSITSHYDLYFKAIQSINIINLNILAPMHFLNGNLDDRTLFVELRMTDPIIASTDPGVRINIKPIDIN